MTADQLAARRPLDTMKWADSGLLAPLPSALLAGRDLDLLAPMRFLAPGAMLDAPVPRPLADRPALAAALGDANASYGHPGAQRLARQLADPQTRVVVTGQQPGLFGGPLYTLTKMVAAALWAVRLQERGIPAIAVFWVATEDHDWSEVAHASFAGPEGAKDLSLGPDPAPLTPVGMRTFGPGLDELFSSLALLQPGLAETDFHALLRRWYRPDARFGEAFCRLSAHLLGERCPLLLDSMLPAVKTAEQPLLRRLVTQRQEVELALRAAEGRLAARGYSPQVDPQPGAAPLFFLHGEARRRILWEPEGTLALRGGPTGWPIEQLLAAIDENPAVVSPGALSRPAIQDALLGSTLQVLGPGEVSYMAQASALYPVLGVEAPWVTLRPQALVLEASLRRHFEGRDLAAILDARVPLERVVAERGGPNFVAAERERIASAVLALQAPAMALDPTLERPLEKTREQIERALEAFSGKVDAAAARRDGTALGRLGARGVCPSGRCRSVFSRWRFRRTLRTGFVDALWTQLDLDPSTLQVISPDGPQE